MRRTAPDALQQIVSGRLKAAGFKSADPALVFLRAWNATASERQIIRVETRRGQFGQTRQVRLDELQVPTPVPAVPEAHNRRSQPLKTGTPQVSPLSPEGKPC